MNVPKGYTASSWKLFQGAVKKALGADTGYEWWMQLSRRERELMLKEASRQNIQISRLFTIIRERVRQKQATLMDMSSSPIVEKYVRKGETIEDVISRISGAAKKKKAVAQEFFDVPPDLPEELVIGQNAKRAQLEKARKKTPAIKQPQLGERKLIL